MPDRTNHRLNGASKNGSVLPFSQLSGLSDQELAQRANDGHQHCVEAIRTSVKQARDAGAALNEMKHRIKKNKDKKTKWADWLAEHFDASAETARVYMRIARDWDKVIKADLENSDTIEELREFLAVPKKPHARAGSDSKGPTGASDAHEQNDSNSEHESEGDSDPIPDPAKNDRVITLTIPYDDYEQFEDKVNVLMVELETVTDEDTIIAAVEAYYEVKFGT